MALGGMLPLTLAGSFDHHPLDNPADCPGAGGGGVSDQELQRQG